MPESNASEKLEHLHSGEVTLAEQVLGYIATSVPPIEELKLYAKNGDETLRRALTAVTGDELNNKLKKDPEALVRFQLVSKVATDSSEHGQQGLKPQHLQLQSSALSLGAGGLGQGLQVVKATSSRVGRMPRGKI